MPYLAGMMGYVAGEQALFAVGADQNAHMARAVAGCRDQGDLVAQPGVAGNKVGLAGIDDRFYGVVEDRCLVRLVAVVAPVFIFGFAEHIACIANSRHPFAVYAPCITA